MNSNRTIKVTSLLICGFCLLPCGRGNAAMVDAFYDDFDGGQIVAPGISAAFSGVTTTEGVQGYAGVGNVGNQFSGTFLRNKSGGSPKGTSGSPTVLTLNNLPTHTSIDLNFLLAIIDSWDIESPANDKFSVRIDGSTIFSENFTANPNSALQGYQPPSAVQLLARPFPQLGFNEGFEGQNGFDDSAYDLGADPVFNAIPHALSTLTIEFLASGPDWQGGGDESFGIENIQIVLNGVPVPELPTAHFWLVAFALSLGLRRRPGQSRVSV